MPRWWSTAVMVRGRSWPHERCDDRGTLGSHSSRGTFPSGGVQASVKRNSARLRPSCVRGPVRRPSAQSSTPRRGLATHHQAGDVAVGHRESPAGYAGRGRSPMSPWNQEQLRCIWMEVSTIVALVREPECRVFFVIEPGRVRPRAGQVLPLATTARCRCCIRWPSCDGCASIAGACRRRERPGPRTTS